MKRFRVHLNSIESVKLFVNLATQEVCEIDVTSERYVVDGKSMLGLFSLDLSKSVGVLYLGEDADAERFYKAVSAVLETEPEEEGEQE